MSALRFIEWAGYTLACWVVASLLLFMMYLPAFPAEKKCTITMAQVETLIKDSASFEDAAPMPGSAVSGFIKEFNGAPPKSGAADGVTVWQHKEIPLLRVVFSKGKCFVNYFDMPIPSFLSMLQRSRGDSI